MSNAPYTTAKGRVVMMDQGTATWRALVQFLEDEISKGHEDLETPGLEHAPTEAVRGRLDLAKRLLSGGVVSRSTPVRRGDDYGTGAPIEYA